MVLLQGFQVGYRGETGETNHARRGGVPRLVEWLSQLGYTRRTRSDIVRYQLEISTDIRARVSSRSR